jgi:hypothetical protein
MEFPENADMKPPKGDSPTPFGGSKTLISLKFKMELTVLPISPPGLS